MRRGKDGEQEPKFERIPGKEFKVDAGINWQRLQDYIDAHHPRASETEEAPCDANPEEQVTRRKHFGCCCAQLG